jgi:hypothetical protein
VAAARKENQISRCRHFIFALFFIRYIIFGEKSQKQTKKRKGVNENEVQGESSAARLGSQGSPTTPCPPQQAEDVEKVEDGG